ncbi:MAG: hypothetical protein F4X14_21590 [Caldilineaceae bacterium SB0661_bin_32]|uniref:Uncharacterized protein n=1 Tax=Caldilineaceae bacterium SB0661_bin_32 TaxID=2605255 RepID=A0A6B1DE74_9CHLR|nr:hypothetical protein [Caldilineaceae bacterium SB0661_bin_32]
MAEDTVQEDTAVAGEDAKAAEQSATKSQGSDRPNSFAFATFLFGGWAALMIVLTLIAVAAMSLVGMVAG